MIGREGIARTRAARGCRRIRSHGRSARQRTTCSLVMAVLVVFGHLQFSQTRDSQSCLKMCEKTAYVIDPLIPAVIRFCTWVDDA